MSERRNEIDWLRKAAREGDVDAQYDLACAYADGNGVPASHHTAFRWFSRAAEQGDAESMTAVGYYLLHGEGARTDPEEALAWFRRAADLGDSDAPRYIASCMMYGDGMPVDVEGGLALAREWWERTHDSEYAHLLACAYNDLFEDDEQSLEWHQLAADLGHDESMVWMGYYTRYGIGVERDLRRAFEWYRQAAAEGNDAGYANLAICYQNGEGVKANDKRAFEYRQKAADLGHEESLLILASCFIHGIGTEADVERGVALLETLAEHEPEAALTLGEKYYYGDGLDADPARAYELFEQAARQDMPEAFTFLADCHRSGTGVDKIDVPAARRLYERAAELGDPHAMYCLAELHESGEARESEEEYERRFDVSHEWLEKAAALGHGPAACLLAERSIAGDGMPRDAARAVEYLRIAVEEEDPDALYMMAECARDGVGVDVDLRAAYELFELAGIQGRDTRVELGQVRRKLRGK